MVSTHLSDAALMRRVARGDSAAFELLYRRHRGPAYRQALEITRRPPYAEEVLQDAFLSLWTGAQRYDPSRASLGTWLGTIVRNRAIDSLRRATRYERDLAFEESAAAGVPAARPEGDPVNALERRGVRSMLSELPAEQREVVFLGFYAGLTQPEIAARIDRPIGTVKSRQRLALAKLTGCFASAAAA